MSHTLKGVTMGMFDYVKCEVALPDGNKEQWFQTKDFDDPYLGEYIIKPDGSLTLEGKDVIFHGQLNFYALNKGLWHEYNAKFSDGKLVEIAAVSNGDGKA